jgi:ribosomal protein S6
MDRVTVVIKYEKDYAEYRYILTRIDEIAEKLNIDKYLLRYLILKEFANNEKWQNELIEKLKKNGQ